MKDAIGQPLKLGDKVAFPYKDEILAKGTIEKVCKKKIKIKTYIEEDEIEVEKLRYPQHTIKIW